MEDIVLDREYKSSLRCLKIGDKVAELPIIPGGVQSEGNKKAYMEGKGDCQGKRAGRC